MPNATVTTTVQEGTEIPGRGRLAGTEIQEEGDYA